MLYKVESGQYEGSRDIKHYTSLSLPFDVDVLYFQSKVKRNTDYLKLSEYNPILKIWDHVSSMLNF